MKISERMSRDVRVAAPTQSVREAAKLMSELDVGALPVGENDRLIGIITDRDIAIRGVAAGRGPDTPVRDVMSSEVKYCYEDQSIEDVAQNMSDIRVRRLPVVNRDKRLVGIVSLGDLAVSGQTQGGAAEALEGISQAGGPHNQSNSSRH
jgi:CBS domain-containing protein